MGDAIATRFASLSSAPPNEPLWAQKLGSAGKATLAGLALISALVLALRSTRETDSRDRRPTSRSHPGSAGVAG
jgi:hypothetical protein